MHVICRADVSSSRLLLTLDEVYEHTNGIPWLEGRPVSNVNVHVGDWGLMVWRCSKSEMIDCLPRWICEDEQERLSSIHRTLEEVWTDCGFRIEFNYMDSRVVKKADLACKPTWFFRLLVCAMGVENSTDNIEKYKALQSHIVCRYDGNDRIVFFTLPPPRENIEKKDDDEFLLFHFSTS